MEYEKKHTKILILMIISFISINCSTYNIDSLCGKYVTKGGFEWGSFIKLNKDSTFLYTRFVSGSINETKGKWYSSGNKLVLNSEKQPQKDTTPNFYLVEKQKNERKLITIDLIDNTKEPIVGASAIMFAKTDIIEKTFSDIEGRIVFFKQPFDSIKIQYFVFKNILIHDVEDNYFKIMTVEKQEIGYQFFTDEKWTIKRRKLIDKTKNEIYYEKTYRKVD